MIDVIVTAMMLFSGLALAFALLFYGLSKRAEGRLRKTQQEYYTLRQDGLQAAEVEAIRRFRQVAEVEANRRFWQAVVETQAAVKLMQAEAACAEEEDAKKCGTK